MTKVLVVDDEPALLRAVGAALKARDYEVVTATTGQGAIDAVDVGQVEVEDDEGGRVAGDHVDGLLAGDGTHDPVATGLQPRPQGAQDGRLVVDHQDGPGFGHGVRPLTASAREG